MKNRVIGSLSLMILLAPEVRAISSAGLYESQSRKPYVNWTREICGPALPQGCHRVAPPGHLWHTMTISRNGNKVYAGKHGRIAILSGATQEELMHFEIPEYHVRSIQASPDGRFIAACVYKTIQTGYPRFGGFEYSFPQNECKKEEGLINVWDLDTKKLVKQFVEPEYFACWPTFCDKSNILSACIATQDGDSLVQLNVLTNKIVRQVPLRLVDSATVSADGSVIATGLRDGTICLWRAGRAKPVQLQQYQAEPVTSLSFSPDGKRLAAVNICRVRAGKGWAGTFCIWDVSTKNELSRSKVGGAGVVPSVALSFSADSKSIAMVENDNVWPAEQERAARLRVTDSATGQDRWRAHLNGAIVTLLEFSRDGNILLGRSSRGIELWSGGGQWLHTLAGKSYEFTPDSKRLIVCDRRIIEWDLQENRELRTWPYDLGQGRDLRLSEDGNVLLCVGDSLTVWDFRKQEFLGARNKHAERIKRMQFSPDSKYLASLDWFGRMGIWDVSSRKCVVAPSLIPHGNIEQVVFGADNKHLSIATSDGVIQLWSLKKGKVIQEFVVPAHQGIHFDSSGERLAFLNENGEISLWQTCNGKEIGRCLAYKGMKNGYGLLDHFAPNGKIYVYWAGGDTLRLWDIDNRKERHRITIDSNSGIIALAISANSKLLAWSAGKLIHLCDIETGKELCVLRGHSKEITGLEFGRDGQSLASIGRDGTLRSWNISSRKQLWTVRATARDNTKIWVPATGPSIGEIRGFSGQTMVDFEAGKIIGKMSSERYSFVAPSPDGRWLTAISKQRIGIMEMATGLMFPDLPFVEQCGISVIEISPDGETIACGGADGSILLWDWRTATRTKRQDRPRKLSTKELWSCWSALGECEPFRAYCALDKLEAAPVDTVEFLRQRLQPASHKSQEEMDRLICGLTSTSPDRMRTLEEIQSFGAEAQLKLRQVLTGKLSNASRSAINDALSGDWIGQYSEPTLRCIRAVQILEKIASSEAIAILKLLSTGCSESPQTREARAAILRLSRSMHTIVK